MSGEVTAALLGTRTWEIEDQLGEPLSMETLDGFGALSQYTLDAIVGLLSGTIPEAACACESCAPAQHG